MAHVVLCCVCGSRRPCDLRECPNCDDRLRSWSREEIREMMEMDRIPALDEILPVTDDVRAEAERDVLVHLDRAVSDVGAAIVVTYNDELFHRLIAAMRELKAAQRECEGRA